MKQGTKHVLLSAAITLGLSTLACASFVDRAIDKTVDTAANKVGERVGEVIAGKILADLEPAMMHIYTTSVFRVLFYHGGYYHVEDMNAYEPGEYTRWRATNVEQGDQFERVLLHRNEDGTEWWRVESRGKTDDGEELVLIMEALLADVPGSGSKQVRRMRAKFPDETEPREIPITEENANQWIITSNHSLTPESLEGMTVNEAESVTVPAGTYTARHVQMKGYDNQSRVDWYMVDSVPGGLVRYSNTAKDGDKDEKIWDVVLLETGSGQTESKLGIDLTAAPSSGGDAPAEGAPAEGAPES